MSLHPLDGIVRVRQGTTLIAESRSARVTLLPECNGELRIPSADVHVAVASLPQLAWHAPDGMVGFDAARLDITVEDHWPDGTAIVNRFPRWGDAVDLLRIMDLVPAGAGLYEAPIYEDRRRNVVEGSQLLGQAIIAAAKEVPDQRPISAHMIFSRPAAFDLPLFFRVETRRRGRSFCTLAVEAVQEGKSIGSALVLTDAGAPHTLQGQMAMPALPGPAQSQGFVDYGMTGREVRFVNGDYSPDPDRIGPPELDAWVRFREQPATLGLRLGLLAQFTGHMTIAASMLPHPGIGEAQAHVTLSTGVLAITIALHEDPDLTRWFLYHNPAIQAGHGLCQGEGHVFADDGKLLASYTVQAMVRDFVRPAGSYGLDASKLM